MRWIRIVFGVAVVSVLALGAGGDAAGGRGDADSSSAAPAGSGGEGFLYGDWIRGQAVSDFTNSGDDKFSAPASFWQQSGSHIRDGVQFRLRSALLAAVPDDKEVRDILVRYGNGGEFDMREWQQLRSNRLREHLRELPIAVIAESERWFADEIGLVAQRRLGFVRRARVDFQSPLGGRKGQLGIDAAGALRERDNDVIGWQLRAYGGENNAAGGNAGLFWRVAEGEHLFGGNLFADYEEDDEDGGFWRWSLGAEWKSRYGELSANHYRALTDGKLRSDSRYAYTRGGFDIDAVVRAPGLEWLSASFGYYQWRGEYGDSDDDGLRYGLRAEPGGGLQLAISYDAESGDVGGELSYSRTLGEDAPPAQRAATFDPRGHFFDAVRREYSQRISRSQPQPKASAMVRVQSAPIIIAVRAAGDSYGAAILGAAGSGLPLTASVRQPMSAAMIMHSGEYAFPLQTPDGGGVTLTTGAAAITQTLSAAMRLESKQWYLTLAQNSSVEFLGGGITLSVGGGRGILRLSANAPMSALLINGAVISLFGARLAFDSGGGTARVYVFDGSVAVVPPGGGVSVVVVSALALDVLPVSLITRLAQPSGISLFGARGGVLPYRYTLLSPSSVFVSMNADSGVLDYVPPDHPQTLAIIAAADDSLGVRITTTAQLTIINPPPIEVAAQFSASAIPKEEFAQMRWAVVSGGYVSVGGGYRLSLAGDTSLHDGEVAVSIIAEDDHANTLPATLILTVGLAPGTVLLPSVWVNTSANAAAQSKGGKSSPGIIAFVKRKLNLTIPLRLEVKMAEAFVSVDAPIATLVGVGGKFLTQDTHHTQKTMTYSYGYEGDRRNLVLRDNGVIWHSPPATAPGVRKIIANVVDAFSSTVRLPLTISIVWPPIKLSVLHRRPLVAKNITPIIAIVTASGGKQASLANVHLIGGGANRYATFNQGTIRLNAGNITGVMTVLAIADDEESSTAPATVSMLVTVYENYVLTATDPSWGGIMTITTREAAGAPRELAEIAADGSVPLLFNAFDGNVPSYLSLTSDAGRARLLLASPPQDADTVILTLWVREGFHLQLRQGLLLTATLAIVHPQPLTISVLDKPPNFLVADDGIAIGGAFAGSGGWLPDDRPGYYFSLQFGRTHTYPISVNMIDGTVFMEAWHGGTVFVTVIMDDGHSYTPPMRKSFTVHYLWPMRFGYRNPHHSIIDRNSPFHHISVTSDIEQHNLGDLWATRSLARGFYYSIVNPRGYMSIISRRPVLYNNQLIFGAIRQTAAITDPPGIYVVTAVIRDMDVNLSQAGTVRLSVDVRAPPLSITVIDIASVGRGLSASVGVVSILRGYVDTGTVFGATLLNTEGHAEVDNNGVIYVRAPSAQNGMLTVVVSVNDSYDYTEPVSASFAVLVVDPPVSLALAPPGYFGAYTLPVAIAGWRSSVGKFTVSGGRLGAIISLSAVVDSARASLSFDGVTMLVSAGLQEGFLTATVIADDDSVHTPAATAVVIISIAPPNDNLSVVGTLTAGITASVTLAGSYPPRGGFPPYRFSLAAPRDDISFLTIGGSLASVVFRGSTHAPGSLTATVELQDSRNQRAQMLLMVDFVRAPSLSIVALTVNEWLEIGTDDWAVSLSSSGGYGAHTLFLADGQTLLSLADNSVLRVSSSLPITALATIYADDENIYTGRNTAIMPLTILAPMSLSSLPLITLTTRASLTFGGTLATLSAAGGDRGDGYGFSVSGDNYVSISAGSVLVWHREQVENTARTIELTMHAADNSEPKRRTSATMSLVLVHPSVSLSVVQLLSVVATGIVATAARAVFLDGAGSGYSLVVIGAGGASLSARVAGLVTLVAQGISLGAATITVIGADDHPDSQQATAAFVLRLSTLLRLPPPPRFADVPVTVTLGSGEVLATLRAENTVGAPLFDLIDAPPVVSLSASVLSFLSLSSLPRTIVITARALDEAIAVADLRATATALLTIVAVPSPVSLLFAPPPEVVTGTVTAATLIAGGGYVSVGGSYAYSVSGNGVSVAADGAVVIISDAPRTLTATLFADDNHHYTPQASLSFTIAAPDRLTILPDGISLTTRIALTAQVLSLRVRVGAPPYFYALANTLPEYLRFADGVFDIVGKPPDNPESLSVVVQVSDSSAIQRRAAMTISVTIGHPPPLAGVFGGDGIVSAGGDAAQLVFSVFGGALSVGGQYQLSATAMHGATIVEVGGGGNVRLSAFGRLGLHSVTAVFVADDNHPHTAPLTAHLTLTADAGFYLSPPRPTITAFAGLNLSLSATLDLATIRAFGHGMDFAAGEELLFDDLDDWDDALAPVSVLILDDDGVDNNYAIVRQYGISSPLLNTITVIFDVEDYDYVPYPATAIIHYVDTPLPPVSGIINYSALQATASVAGSLALATVSGIGTSHGYRYSLLGGGGYLQMDSDGVLLLSGAPPVLTATVSVVVSDRQIPDRASATLRLSLQFLPAPFSLRLSPPDATAVVVSVSPPRAHLTMRAFGGVGGYGYSGLDLPQGFALSGAVLWQTATLSAAATLILTLQAQDAGVPPYSASANFTITAAPLSPLSVSVLYVPGVVAHGSIAATMRAFGGVPPYRYVGGGSVLADGVVRLFAPVSGTVQVSMTVVISDDYSQTGDLSVVLSASVFRARSPLPGVFFGNGAAVTSVVGTMRHIGGVSAVLAGVRRGLTGRVMPDGIFSVSASARGNDDYVLRLYSALKSHGAFVATLIAGDAVGVYDPVSAIFSVLASAPSGEVLFIGGGVPSGYTPRDSGNVLAASDNDLDSWTVRASVRQLQLINHRAILFNGTIVVAGGRITYDLNFNQPSSPRVMWSEDLGHTWRGYDLPFAPDVGFGMVAHNGAIYIVGNTVWRSTDALSWTRLTTRGLPAAAGLPLVSHRGSLVMPVIDNYEQYRGAWTSPDGINWSPPVRGHYNGAINFDVEAVSHKGRVYLYWRKNRGNVAYFGDDPNRWTRCGGSAPYLSDGMSGLSFAGSVYIFGGDTRDIHGSDGCAQAQTQGSIPWDRRSRFQVVYLPYDTLPFTVAPIPPPPRPVFDAPLTLTAGITITATTAATANMSSGRPPYFYNLIAAPRYLQIDNSGAIVVVGGPSHSAAGKILTASVRISDTNLYPGPITAPLTIKIIAPFALSATAFAKSGWHLTGAVAGTVRVVGGVLPYSYSGALSIDEESGEYAFNPVAGFESGSVMSATVVVRDRLLSAASLVVSARVGYRLPGQGGGLNKWYGNVKFPHDIVARFRTTLASGALTGLVSPPDNFSVTIVALGGGRFEAVFYSHPPLAEELYVATAVIGDSGGKYFPLTARISVRPRARLTSEMIVPPLLAISLGVNAPITFAAKTLPTALLTVHSMGGFAPLTFALLPGGNLAIGNDGVVYAASVLTAAQTLVITAHVSDDAYLSSSASGSFTVVVADAPENVRDINIFVSPQTASVLIAGHPATVASVSVVGGYAPGGYALSAVMANGAASVIGDALLISASIAGMITATLIADDIYTDSQPATAFLTARVYDSFSLAILPAVRTVILFRTAPQALATISASGGSGSYLYSLASPPFGIALADRVISMTAIMTLSATMVLTALVEDAPFSATALMTIVAESTKPLSATTHYLGGLLRSGDIGGTIAGIGGLGAYRFTSLANVSIHGTNGEFRMLAPGGLAPGALLTASALLTDDDFGLFPLSVFLTVRIGRDLPIVHRRVAVTVGINELHHLGDIGITAAISSSLFWHISPSSFFTATFAGSRTDGGTLFVQSALDGQGVWTATAAAYADGYFPITAFFTAQAPLPEGEVFLIGGSRAGQYTNGNTIVYVASPDNLSVWNPVATIAPFSYGRVANLNGTLVVIGRTHADNIGDRTRAFWSADRGRTWNSYTLPFDKLNDFGMAIHNGAVYVIGGYDNYNSTGRTWRSRDIAAGASSWQLLGHIAAAWRAEAISYRGSLHIINAKYQAPGGTYVLEGDAWRKTGDGGIGNRRGPVFAFGGRLYVYERASRRVWLYGGGDIHSDWRKCSEGLGDAYEWGILPINGTVYLFGNDAVAGGDCLPEVAAKPLLPATAADNARFVYLPRVNHPVINITPPLPLRAGFDSGLRITSGARLTAALATVIVRGGKVPYRYSVVGDVPGYLSLGGGVFSVVGGAPLASVSATVLVSLAVRDSYIIGARATAVLTLMIVPPVDLSASAFVGGGGGLVRASALVGSVIAAGLTPIRFSSASPSLTLNTQSGVFGFLPGTASGTTITATIIADDDGYLPPVTMVVSARAGVDLPAVFLPISPGVITVRAGEVVGIAKVRASSHLINGLTAAAAPGVAFQSGGSGGVWTMHLQSSLATGGLRTFGITVGDIDNRYFPLLATLTVSAQESSGEVLLIGGGGGSVVYAAHNNDLSVWVPRASVGGLALHGHRVVDINGTIVVVGGKKPDGSFSKQVWRSPDRGTTWLARNSADNNGGVPVFFGHAALVHNNAIYAIGGLQNGNPSGDVYRLENPGGLWQRVSRGVLPPMTNRGAVSFRGAIIIPRAVTGSLFYSYSGGRDWHSTENPFDEETDANEVVVIGEDLHILDTGSGGNVASLKFERISVNGNAICPVRLARQPDASALVIGDAAYLIGGGLRAVRRLSGKCPPPQVAGMLPSDSVAVSVRAVFLPYDADYRHTVVPPPPPLQVRVVPNAPVSLAAHTLSLTLATVQVANGRAPYRFSLVNAPSVFALHSPDGVLSFAGSIAAGTMTLTAAVVDSNLLQQPARRAEITIITAPLGDVSLSVRNLNNLNFVAKQPLRTVAILYPNGGFAGRGYTMRALITSSSVFATVVNSALLVSAAQPGAIAFNVIADDMAGLVASRSAVQRFVLNAHSPMFVSLSAHSPLPEFYDVKRFTPRTLAAVYSGGGYSSFEFGRNSRPRHLLEVAISGFGFRTVGAAEYLVMTSGLLLSSDVFITVRAEDYLSPPSQMHAVLTIKRISPLSLSVAMDDLLPGWHARATASGLGGVPPYSYTGIGVNVGTSDGIIHFRQHTGKVTVSVAVADATPLTPHATMAIIATLGASLHAGFDGQRLRHSVVVGLPRLIGQFSITTTDAVDLTFRILPKGVLLVRHPWPLLIDLQAQPGGSYISIFLKSADFYAAPSRAGFYEATVIAGVTDSSYVPKRAVYSISAAASGGEVLLIGGTSSIVWAAAESQPTHWSPRATIAGLVRARHRVVAHSGTIIVVGGDNNNGRRIYWSADKGHNWQNYASPFGARHSFGMAVFRGAVYVAGGYDNNGNRRADVWRSEDSRNWQQITTHGFAANGIAEHQMVSYNGALIIPGGNNGGNAAENRRLYRSSDGVNWNSGFSHPSYRDSTRGYALAVHNGSLYMHGIKGNSGGVWHSGGNLDRWSRCGFGRGREIAPGRSGANALSFGGSLYFFGGGALSIRRTSGCPPQAADGGQTPPGTEYAHAVHISRSAVPVIAPLPVALNASIVAPGIATLTAKSAQTAVIGTVAAFGGAPPYDHYVTYDISSFISVDMHSGVLYQAGTVSAAASAGGIVMIMDISNRRNLVIMPLSLVIVPPLPLSAQVAITSGAVGISVVAATISAVGGAVPYRFSALGGHSDINASLGYVRFLDGIGGGSVVVRAFDVRDGAGSAYTIFLTATVLYHLPGALTRATSGVVPVNFGALSRLGEFRATLADDISMTAAVDSPGQFGVTVASIGGGRFAAYFRSALTIGGRHTLQIVVGDSGGRYAPFRAAFTAEAARGEVIVLGASDNGRQVWVAADNNLQDWHKRKSFSAAQTGGGRMVNFNGTLVAAITIDNNNLNISYSPDRGKSWIKTAQNFSPRTGFGMAVHNGAIYIIGGSGRDYLLRDVWRSINIRDWQKLPAPGLDAMADFPLISHNGSLIIPGGRQNYGDDSSRRVYSADRNFWQRDVAGGDAPRVGRFDKHAAAVYNGKVYIYGLDDSVYAFDTADNWLSCGRTFARRAGAQALVFAGRVHLFGGGTRTIARMNGCPPVEASPGQTPPDTEQGAPAVYLPFAPPAIIAPPPPLLQVSVNATAPLTITAGGLATVNLLTMHLRGGTPPFAYSVVAPYLTISGNVVMLAGAPPVATTAAISVRITDRDLLPSTIFAVFTLAAVSPPPVSIDIISQTPVLVVGESAQTILISASGGFVGDGDYRIIGNDTTVFAAAGSIAEIKISAAQTGALTLTLSANDNHNDTPAASALLILPVVAPLRLSAAYQLISVIATLSPPRAHNRLAESGGFGARRLSLINPPFGFVLDGKVISITAILQTITTLTLTAAVADSNNPPRRATTTIPVIVAPLAPFGARLLINKGILPSNENVALVQPFGGVEDYLFRTDGAVANVNRSGEVYFHLPRGGGLSVITAVITVNDSYHSEETPPVYLTLTATIAPRLIADVDGNENIRTVSANRWTPIGTIEVDKDNVGSLTATSSPFGLARGEDFGLNSDNDRQMRIWAGPATAGLYTILLTTADRAGRYAPSTSRWTISAQAQTGAITLKPPMRGRFLPQRIMTITAMLNITILLATMTIEGGLQPISFSVYGVPPRHPDFATTRFPDWLAIDSDGVISVFKAVLNTMLLDGERGWAMTARATDALGQMVQSAFTIHVIPKNDFVAALENTTPIIAAGSYANVATVSISGGHIAEDYRLRFFGGGDAAYRIGGRVVAVSAASPGVITATVIADDDIARYAPITILLTLTALPPLQIDMDKVSIVITVPSSLPAGSPLLTAIASGGKPPYSYRIDWSSGESPMAVGDDGIISLAAYLRYSDSQKVSPLFWNLQVRDSSGYLRATKRRLRFAYSAADISISQTRVGDGVIAVGNTFATVAQLAASGGYLKNSREKYVFSLITVIGASISARVNDDGKVSARAISAGIATAVVIADDRHNSSKPATTRIIITAADASNFTAAISGVKGSIFASVPVAVATLSVSGGYLAAGGTYDLRGAASHGAISFGGAQPSGFAITLLAPSAGLITATIIADDNHLSSPPKTLLLTTRAIHGASIIVPDDLADGVIVVAVDYRNLRVILTATGGIENYRFSLINNRADLSLRQPRRGMDKGFEQNGNILSMLFTRHRVVKSYTISISLTDGNSASAPAHLKTTMTFIFTLSVVPRNSAATSPVFPDSPPVMQTPPLSSASHPILKLASRTSGGNPFFNHPLPPYHPRKRQSAAATTTSPHKR